MSEAYAREAGPERLASLLLDRGVLTADWLPVFRAVPREAFVPEVMWPGQTSGTGQGEALDRRTSAQDWREAVYSDISLTTQWDDGLHTGSGRGRSPTCSNSQPSMVFAMLAALEVAEGQRVLEIGTGTGWNAALLSERVGSQHVVTVEVDAENARTARQRVADAGYTPTMVLRDGAAGFAPAAPYDRVLITASVTRIPPQVIGQTRPGGRIVAPFAPTYGSGAVVALTVGADGRACGPFVQSAAFMRLRQHRYARKHTREYLGGRDWPADGVRSVTVLSPDAVGDWLPMFVIGLKTRDMFPWMEQYQDGSYTLWLRDTAVTSWATADYVPGADTYEVYQSGPRSLWDEAKAAYRWWEDEDRPGFDRFGLSTGPDGHNFWLDTPDAPLCPVS